MLWYSIQNQRRIKQLFHVFKKALYNWILHYIQDVQSSIANDYLKLSMDGSAERHLVTKLLFRLLVRYLNKTMGISPEEGGLKDARYVEYNIIISDSTLRNVLPPKLNNMTARNKVMCGCECFISHKGTH